MAGALMTNVLTSVVVAGAVANKGRCTCCDLPTYSCGTAAIRELRTEDPEFAAFIETPEGARL